ncbi:signal peptidase II [Agrobacterium rosae]|uniref:Lipoprotein signal peptidase n=1 Tax=Agrobacterium rosae TaxID=1972867 RepID=A0AAW9FK06_9HYPH|nr:signal peptidase II [Agrobacterium rosae]MDX8305476.1 signal peptidase II [Agrobacterium rosae]
MDNTQRENKKTVVPTSGSRHPVSFVWPLLMVVFVLAFDQAVKFVIVHLVMNPPQPIEVTPFFNVVLVYNRGISFGMLADFIGAAPQLFSWLKLLIVMGLIAWAYKTKVFAERLALCIIAGGALGNISDRFLNGAVTDYLNFHWNGLHWPAFNIADIAVVGGAVAVAAVPYIFTPKMNV